MSYIKPAGITKKIRLAKRNESILFIRGIVGSGKTAAIQYAFRRKKHVYATARNGMLQLIIPDPRKLASERLAAKPVSSARADGNYMADASLSAAPADRSIRNAGLSAAPANRSVLNAGLSAVPADRSAPDADFPASTDALFAPDAGRSAGPKALFAPDVGRPASTAALFAPNAGPSANPAAIPAKAAERFAPNLADFLNPAYLLSNEYDTVVIDDVQFLRDLQSIKLLEALIPERSIQLIFCSRGVIPGWLASHEGEREIMLADDKDLLLSPDEFHEFIEDKDVSFSREDERRIYDLTRGLPIYGNFVLLHAADGILTEEREVAATDSFYRYMDTHFYEEIDRVHSEKLLVLCHFPKFDLELARVLTADYRIPIVLDNMLKEGNYLVKCSQTDYRIREPYRGYLVWKYSFRSDIRYDSEVFGRAAVYYNLQNRPIEALRCLVLSRSQQRLKETVIDIARNEPMQQACLGYLNEYMNKLTAETLHSTPVLMAARSMSYSLYLNPSLSEEWYKLLAEYALKPDIKELDRKEARYRLAFLDLMLPHRGLQDVEARLTRLIEAQTAWNGVPGQMSFTGIHCSYISGLFDLTQFHGSGIEQEGNRRIMRMASHLLNTRYEGFRDLLREEFLFESGDFDEFELSERINGIYMMAERTGDEDACFVSVGILTRLSLYTGRYDMIRQLLDNYKTKLKRRDLEYLIPSAEALSVWSSLMQGNNEAVDAWFETAPDSTVTFTLPLVNFFLLKLRIYLSRGQYDHAGVLVGRLENTLSSYKRTYKLIETQTLKAIMLYRQGSPNWAPVLEDALTKAESVGILQLLVQEGAALLPLLKKLPKENASSISSSYLTKLITRTERMANRNPNYLRLKDALEEPLTDAERNVLKMLCMQMTSKEMCKELHITYSGLKYHKGNIYRKLGVKGRVEAQRKAEDLNLI